MNHDKIFRLKKYLFFISIFVFLPLFGHLIYIYLYNDSKIEIVNGGTIYEAIIGNPPSLNPLKPLSGDNKYVVNLLYRSLLSYDITEKKIVSDIASCDLNNLLNIKCNLKSDIKWSNGEKITINDIISTYKIYKNSDINPIMSKLLSNTDIKSENDSIIFSSTEAHVKFLDVFLSPIVPENVINKVSLDENKVNIFSSGGIYSGKYTIESLGKKDEDGAIKLSLIRNKDYKGNNINVEKLVLDFFPNSTEFLKHKDNITIFNDDNNIVGNSIPRLKNNSFYLPQYVSIFINKDNITDENLRNYILNKINRKNLLKIIGEQNFKQVKNPYLTDISIDKEEKDKNINKILSNIGYYKKSELLGKLINSTKIPESSSGIISAVISTGAINNQVYSIDKFQEKSKVIIEPNNINKYNFITKDDILLKGKAGKDIKSIYVNEYKLNGYRSGNDIFYYRIKEGVKNIKQGVNKYSIYFDINGKKELVDELYFIYYKNKDGLENQKQIFIKSLYGIKEENIVNKAILVQEKTKKLVQNEKIRKQTDEKIKKINSLEDKYYYNEKLEKLSYNLTYVNSEKDMELTANYIKNVLNEEGIIVNIKPITIEQLASIISKEGDDKNYYDLILVAINLGNFDFDISSYFHSSKVNHTPKSNFSKIKKSELDSLLEKLESNYLPKEQILDIEKNVLDILKEEQVVKVLYTPLINNLVDKSIKTYKNIDYIPDKSFRNQLIEDIYVTEKKILNLDNKGIIGFVKFLLKSLNE